MLVVIVILAVAAVSLGAWSASTVIESRAMARRSMDAMQGYETVSVREQQMLRPMSERIVGPVASWLLDVARSTDAGGIRREGASARSCLPGIPPATRSTAS